MAIIPHLPGLEAEIVVNDEPLTEYSDGVVLNRRSNKTRVYVEVNETPAFKVLCFIPESFSSDFDHLVSFVEIDGRRLPTMHGGGDRGWPREDKVVHMEHDYHCNQGRRYRTPFEFKPLRTGKSSGNVARRSHF